MTRRIIFSALFLIFSIYCVSFVLSPALAKEWSSKVIGELPQIKKSDRILILAPHPDDEAIACAGIIQAAKSAGAKIRIVYLTNGDHNEIAFIVYEKRLTLRKAEFIHMGELRRKEAIKAMQLLGVAEDSLVFLGYPDFGTFFIFTKFWQDSRPFRSLLTRISSVPYKDNPSYGAPYKGESILEDLKKIIKEFKPNKVFVSHPADTNPDHKAFYLFLQVALEDLKDELPRPEVYPYLVHCVGWPLPRHYHPELTLMPPEKFLDAQVNWSQYKLSREQLNKKYQAILCYKSQTQSSAFYLLAFARQNELFGDYPEIDLKINPEKNNETGDVQGVSFVGDSNIFVDSSMDMLYGLRNFIQDEGRVSYGLKDNILYIRLDKAKKINRRFSVLLYLFGYSNKIPFARMPKIRIIARANKVRVFDARRIIPGHDVSVKLDSNSFIIKIPLALLGEPDFILSFMKGYREFLPVDSISIRKVNIRRD